MTYYECTDCCYATTSPRHADDHADANPGHGTVAYDENEDFS